MTPAEAFRALYEGPDAVLPYGEARTLVALELDINPIAFRPDRLTPAQEAAFWEAVEIIRSYQEVRHIVEAGEPLNMPANVEEARLLMLPERQRKEASKKPRKQSKDAKTVAAQNNLWQKASY